MLIRDWMTRDVITVTAETPMLKAGKLMKDHEIRCLPVIDDNRRVIGIVSAGDVKAASPSKATTLDMNELYYLLFEMKIKDIMTTDPVTAVPLDTVEQVALLMLEKDQASLPVVDADKKLIGIITHHDIFKVLLNITGVRAGGVQLAFRLPDKIGTLRSIFGVLWDHQAGIISVLSSSDEGGEGERNVYVRIRPMEQAQEDALAKILKERFDLLYWARDEVNLF